MEAPRESPLPPTHREELRARVNAATPWWYSPGFHLAFPSLFGLAVVIWAAKVVHDVAAWELLTIPVVLVLSNAVEWRAHRDLLHRRSVIAPVLYDRHTPIHHMLFLTDDMEVRSRREWRMVLIPPYGSMLIALINAPPTYLLWHAGLRNVAALFLATAVAYVVIYEWLHLAYHLPTTSFVGRLALVRFLRRHHAIHHDPRLMQRWNFNVTLPLWDLVRRTYVSPEDRDTRIAR